MGLKTFVLPPESRLREVCSCKCRSLLTDRFNPVWNELGRDYTENELSDIIQEAEVILTSWGSPVLTEEMLEKAHNLRYIGHAAGTVKNRLPEKTFSRNIKVFSAAPRIAQSVGEYCLAALMMALKGLHRFDAEMHQGTWAKDGFNKGHELTGSTVGIVSASSTARAFIRYLAPFHVNIRVYDPFLSGNEAEDLGVIRTAIEEVMECPVISIHAPSLPETQNMIHKDLLRRIPDNAIFINSSRAGVIDYNALKDELETGRFTAVLDVFPEEPLSSGSPFRPMENVILTPHIAGGTAEGHLALMEEIVLDILRSIDGQSTRYEVRKEAWDILA